MRRISKAQAKKLFAENKSIILCPCKMRPGYPFNMGCVVNMKEWFEEGKGYKGNCVEHAWHLMYNNWSYYNSNYECGYYPHYYVKNEEVV